MTAGNDDQRDIEWCSTLRRRTAHLGQECEMARHAIEAFCHRPMRTDDGPQLGRHLADLADEALDRFLSARAAARPRYELGGPVCAFRGQCQSEADDADTSQKSAAARKTN